MPLAFTMMITPSQSDIDELGHVNNAVWVRWIQDVATAHWTGVSAPEHVERYVWVVTRHEIDYLGNVGAGEAITARTWISDPPKGARFDRNMEFHDATGRLLVRVKTTWAMVDKARGRVVRVPPEVVAPFLGD